MAGRCSRLRAVLAEVLRYACSTAAIAQQEAASSQVLQDHAYGGPGRDTLLRFQGEYGRAVPRHYAMVVNS